MNINEVYSKAYRYWMDEVAAASENILDPNLLSNTDIRCILGRTPSIPSQILHGRLSSCWPSARWRVSESKDCELSGRDETRGIYLRMKTSARVKVNLRRGNSDVQHDHVLIHNSQAHYFAVLVLAWAYILSARLVELQGTESSLLQYAEHHAPINAHEGKVDSHFLIDIGDVDQRVTRWFAAILAPQNSFRASIDFANDDPSWAPWSYCLLAENTYNITNMISDSSSTTVSEEAPLSSYEALQNLLQLCDYHDIGTSQVHAALATALLFPTHGFRGYEVSLLSSRISQQAAKTHTGITIQQDLDNFYEDLPTYIMLSCSCEVMNSLLCGAFWNPHLQSNLCSPWLQPLLDIRDSEQYTNNSDRFYTILAAACARRVPSIAYLFFGAAVSGLMPRILDQVIRGSPPVDPHAYAWMGIPQSFMDLPGESPYCKNHDDKEYILRSDCWRLRRLPPVVDDDLYYRRDPFSPWAPPGFGLLRNCPLRVQVHKHCSRHSWVYEGVRWTFEDGHILEGDMGRHEIKQHVSPDKDWGTIEANQSLEYPGDQQTSMDATMTTFRWVLDTGEGKPLENPYNSPWLSELEYDSEESEKILSSEYDST